MLNSPITWNSNKMDTPLAYAPTECEARDMPSVDELFSKDAYVDAA